MKYIYEDANDQHIRNVIVYATSDGKAYADAEGTKQFKTSELVDLYMKSAVLVNKSGTYYNVVSMTESSGVCTLSYLTNDSALAVATLVSVAD